MVADGDLTEKQRNSLLAEMTDEVAELVLADNYEQNLALANADYNAPSLLHVHEDWMKRLERDGVLNRELEALPTSRQVRRRLDRGEGLTVPELSVLLAWTKIVLADELLATDLPDDPYLRLDLMAYFPKPVQEGFQGQIADHPLRREIIVTQVVNDLVNGAGMTFWPRLAGETGATAAELTRANFVAREIFGSLPLRQELKTYDNVLDARVQTRMRLEMRTLVERASRWLITNRRPPLDSQGTVDFFSEPVQRVMAQLPDLMTGRELTAFIERRDGLVEQGVPEDLATRVAVLNPAYTLLGIIEIATREELDPAEVARVHFALGERLGLPALVQRILALPRDDRWQTMARGAVRDDLYAVHIQLTGQVLLATSPDDPAPARIAAWEDGDSVVVTRAVVDPRGDLRRRLRRPGPDVGRPPRGPRPAGHRVTDLATAGVGETARLTTSGEVTAREVVEAALDRIAAPTRAQRVLGGAGGPRRRAEAAARDDCGRRWHARAAARRTVAIKEEIDVAGTVTTFGGEANTTPAGADAEVVRRLRDAGAVVIGKTTMPEFGAFPYTESDARGITRNPWDPTRRPAAPAAVRRSPWPRAWSRPAWAATAAARSGSPAPAAGCSGSSRSAAGSAPPRTRTCGGRSARPGRSPAACSTARSSTT